MKFGVREIANVVFRAKHNMNIGKYHFEPDMPVFFFDSLKTSSLEGAATTVYAQGGRGNSRLIAWEGERTVTFTMEDALISTVSFSMLSGAGVIEATDSKPILQHVTETVVVGEGRTLKLENSPAPSDDGKKAYLYVIPLDKHGDMDGQPERIFIAKNDGDSASPATNSTVTIPSTAVTNIDDGDLVLVDYYVYRTSKTTQIEITAEKFAGNYYIEADTLFRNKDGVDLPADFIIPNGKIQSNFTFTMAPTGDPSTFTFTVDAFPDYIKGGDKKVIAALQLVEDTEDTEDTFGGIKGTADKAFGKDYTTAPNYKGMHNATATVTDSETGESQSYVSYGSSEDKANRTVYTNEQGPFA